MRVLFYSPYMGYTGSEKMVYYIAKYAQKLEFVVLSGDKGSILLENPSHFHYYFHKESSLWGTRLTRLIDYFTKINISIKHINYIIKRHSIDLIVVNTIVAQKIMPFLKKTNFNFILYSHELPPMYDLVDQETFEFITKNALIIIGCSEKVCNHYKMLGLKNVHLFREAIDINEIRTYQLIELENLRKRFSYIFLMSGQQRYHKGFSFVIQIGEFLKKFNCALIWLGGGNRLTGLNYYIKQVINNKQLDNVFVAGFKKGSDYYSYFHSSDAFLLTSFVDPYPLVMLEAAYFQKPIIAFDSGGVSEFLQYGMGKIVPFYHLDDYLKTIQEFIEGKLYIDKELLQKKALEHDISLNVSSFENIIINILNS